MLSAFVLATVALSGYASAADSDAKMTAVADLKPTQGNKVNGTINFVQQGDKVLVEARVDGLTPGLHGFHVHEKGDCSAPDASSAGGHFNPAGKAHGGPADSEHHAGDFGNLKADASGKATMKMTVPASQVTLKKDASNSVIGKAVVVHAGADDLKSQPAGDSGKRVACGVIAQK